MRRLFISCSALCWLGLLGIPAALGADAAPPGGAIIKAQFDGPMGGGPMMGGPMMGGPGYGMPPGFYPGPYGNPRGPGRRRENARPIRHFTTYHGFRIDLGEAQGRIDVPSVLAEVEHQIDIVDRSAVSPSLLHLFRSVPIRLAASFRGGPGHYRGGSEVSMGSLPSGDDRPVLLHEYMHVLEYKRFPGGFRNPTVQHFYDEALAGNLYPPQSYMMSNPPEFFAVTASCFLNGTVARDPYNRETIREQQPDYYSYLAHLFGRARTAAAKVRSTVLAGLH